MRESVHNVRKLDEPGGFPNPDSAALANLPEHDVAKQNVAPVPIPRPHGRSMTVTDPCAVPTWHVPARGAAK